MSLFEKVLNVYIWIKIFVSPLLLGIVIGFISRYYIGGTKGDIAFGLILAAGIIGGILLAEHLRKQKGEAFHTGEFNFQDYLPEKKDVEEHKKG